MAESDYIIGIDLGTTNSVVAILDGEQPRIITSSEGSPRTPSVVSFLPSGDIVVGEVARRQTAINPLNTITSVKRLMGRSMADIESLGLKPPYELATTDDNQLVIKVGDHGYTPAQVSALILKRMKESAEEFLGEKVDRAIVTVPAYFDDLQRQATREAGEMAGLNVLRLVNEPTAAAMAYGLGRSERERVAVYDFGGGTFDLTVLDISDGTFEVLTSVGDTHLGGDDIDELIVLHLIARFSQQVGFEFEPDPMAFRRLKEAAEKAKCELSSSKSTLIHLPFLSQHDNVPLHLEMQITREELEELIYPLVDRTIGCCREALEDAEFDTNDINKVVLVGGSTRIPLVQDLVEDYFGLQPFKGINPDEIVALGAATQAGVMAGKLKEVLLLDVTPHSLGVEVHDGRTVRVIEKNSTIPIKAARLFTTTEDEQEMVMVHVLQGESERAAENQSLGKFTLTGLQPGKAGSTRVQVTFHINVDGMVEVSAEDMATRQQQSLSLTVGAESDRPLAGGRDRAGSSSIRRRRRRPAKATPEVLTGQNPTQSQSRMRQVPVSLHDTNVPSAFHPVTPLHESRIGPVDLSTMGGQAKGSSAQPPAPVEPPAPKSSAADKTTPDQPTEPLQEKPLIAAKQYPGPSGSSAVRRQEEAATPQSRQKKRGKPDAPSELATEPNSGQPAPDRLSEEAQAALAYIRDQAVSATAFGAYLKVYKELQAYAEANPSEIEVADGTLRMLITLGEKDRAQNLLAALNSAAPEDSSRMADLYDLYMSKFPEDSGAVTGRANVLANIGRLDDAIAALEKVCSDEKGTDAEVESLIQLYRRRLAQGEDPGTQFKLVKLLIRTGHVDEAINLLQRLVQSETYRSRSLKILGLCFWQKGLHYLAWQKFQQLPPSEEIKDILYRLSADMEDTDQLLNAKVVLQHLADADPDYKDVSQRLKRVEQMIRLEAGDREGNMTPSIFLTLKDSRFVILEEINRGSMGIVYRARDKVLEEIVALKILNEYMTGDPTAVERFKREARAAKRLSHQNIVRIHDMFEYGNKKLLSMEYIEGVDLKKVLQERGTLPVTEIANICRPACDALAYAHNLSIIHRDIKPANIMITSNNQVKVTDFGIAKVLLAVGADATQSGSQIIGTPLYMSPEQIKGDPVDARTDVYSLGATMYEMAAGRPPFLEGNIEYHHLHTPPPPLPDSVPPAMAEIIMKCLEKAPADRYKSTVELSNALQGVSSGAAS